MSPTTGQIPKYYSPVRHSSAPSSPRRDHSGLLPFDLHVLSMPPAFNLSQDQTLQFKSLSPERFLRGAEHPSVDALHRSSGTSAHTSCLRLIVKEQSLRSVPQADQVYPRFITPPSLKPARRKSLRGILSAGGAALYALRRPAQPLSLKPAYAPLGARGRRWVSQDPAWAAASPARTFACLPGNRRVCHLPG